MVQRTEINRMGAWQKQLHGSRSHRRSASTAPLFKSRLDRTMTYSQQKKMQLLLKCRWLSTMIRHLCSCQKKSKPTASIALPVQPPALWEGFPSMTQTARWP